MKRCNIDIVKNLKQEFDTRRKGATGALYDAIQLLERKTLDYQNPNSSVKHADYYPRGIDTILDLILAKYLRLRSLSEKVKSGQSSKPEFESLNDNAIDLISYSAFLSAWLKQEIDGQDKTADIFNRKTNVSNNS